MVEQKSDKAFASRRAKRQEEEKEAVLPKDSR